MFYGVSLKHSFVAVSVFFLLTFELQTSPLHAFSASLGWYAWPALWLPFQPADDFLLPQNPPHSSALDLNDKKLGFQARL